MSIELTILPHQNDFLEATRKAFKDIKVTKADEIHKNPIIDIADLQIHSNIEDLWRGYENLHPIPREWRIKEDINYLGLDIRMETGTGKTYCYTRLMYELNELYGFHKFIIIVPSTPIKEGSRSFLEADYCKKHFADLYPNKTLDLSVLDPQKRTSGRKMFPTAVADFARGTILEKNKLSALLMTTGMLLSNATMGKDDYDQTILGNYTQPYQTLESTKPIVIIDEPHRFKKENKAYKRILEKIKPQCIIRFGATFPDKKNSKVKDYNNLIFNLGSTQAFNQNLVKGVETFMIEAEKDSETKLKLMSFKQNPKIAKIREETKKKTIEVKKGDSLSVFGEEFSGIIIDEIGKTEDESITRGVTLSNGQILANGDMVYGGIYKETYQELMMKQALINHFDAEKKNFMRARKIKTLTLFFIDSVHSYRGEEDIKGHLRVKFEEMLSSKIKEEIEILIDAEEGEREKEYKLYLKASFENISQTNGGYFSEDNSTSEKDIQNEVEKILRDKESLLNFKSKNGNWNTMRFIFSKWTLKEGWDNPNVFQIVKLRSSGSETSKLQEVGRGLRLPVDEKGRRVSDEQFYLKYLIDYSEKGFASKLLGEIQSDSQSKDFNIKSVLEKIAKVRNTTVNDIFKDLLNNDYIDMDGKIIEKNLQLLYEDYPEALFILKPNKVIDGNKKKNYVKVRRDKFNKIRHLWEKVNEKYYLYFDEIPEEELKVAFVNILSKDIYRDTVISTISSRTESVDGEIVLKEQVSNYFVIEDKLNYGDFLKQINKQTGLSINLVHKALCEYNTEYEVDDRLFSQATVNIINREFKQWIDNTLLKKFSYKALNIALKETSLTNYKGEMIDELIQGVLGVHRDDKAIVPEQFLYDTVVYDSPKERETLLKSNIDEVIVFGKIPRRSIQIPLFMGGTTSPDFMYVINNSKGHSEINFVVETKDMKNESSLRREEELRIASAKKFFETMKQDGLNVVFKKQLKNDDIVSMIKELTF